MRANRLQIHLHQYNYTDLSTIRFFEFEFAASLRNGDISRVAFVRPSIAFSSRELNRDRERRNAFCVAAQRRLALYNLRASYFVDAQRGKTRTWVPECVYLCSAIESKRSNLWSDFPPQPFISFIYDILYAPRSKLNAISLFSSLRTTRKALMSGHLLMESDRRSSKGDAENRNQDAAKRTRRWLLSHSESRPMISNEIKTDYRFS